MFESQVKMCTTNTHMSSHNHKFLVCKVKRGREGGRRIEWGRGERRRGSVKRGKGKRRRGREGGNNMVTLSK